MKTLALGYKAAGHHIFKWESRNKDGLSVPSGVYFSRLIIKEIKQIDGRNMHRTIYNHVRKMIMVK